ncbi:response regulator [Neptunomonas marina]|nr:response regulator [Neptunomonas marina]
MSLFTIDYSDKQVLLIESSGNMRATIVYMLRQLGVSNIHAVTINDQLMELIQEEAFDIVLLGHNASDSFSGMQILEECRFRGFMKASSCWVFMTSDSSQEVILHAIDSKPDVLITKPFSMDELKARLDLVMYRKLSLVEVDEAVSRGQLDRAVKLCDRVELAGKNYDYVQLVKGRLLLEMGRFEEAEHFFKYRFVHLSEKESGLCLAEALIGQGKLQEASEHLGELLSHFPLLMAAHDLYAKVKESMGEMEEARLALRDATQKSPLSIPRHMELGRVSVYSNSLDVADHAYRKSISLGKHSCYRSPEPFLRLANVKRLQMKNSSNDEAIKLHNQLDEILNHVTYRYPDDPAVRLEAELLRSELERDLNNPEEAKRHLQKAVVYAKQMEAPVDIDEQRRIVKGEPLPKSTEDVADVARAAAVKHDPEMSMRVNRLGVKHYLADKAAQAIRYFGLAIEHDPKNTKALLNLAQLFLESAKQESARRDERLKMVSRYLKLTERMPLEPAERSKLLFLKQSLALPLEELPSGSLGALLR